MSTTQSLAALDAQQRYSIPEALAYLRIGRKSLYREVKAGRLKLLKHGRRSFVHGSELIRASSP